MIDSPGGGGDDDDDEEEDWVNPSHAKKKKGVNISAGVSADNVVSTTRSRRSTSKKTTYTYSTSEDEDDSEEEARVKAAKAVEEDPTKDYELIDRIIGRREHADFAGYYEYLVKYRRSSFKALAWISREEVDAFTRVKSMLSRFDNMVDREGDASFTEEAVQDMLETEGWTEVERVIARKKAVLQRLDEEGSSRANVMGEMGGPGLSFSLYVSMAAQAACFPGLLHPLGI